MLRRIVTCAVFAALAFAGIGGLAPSLAGASVPTALTIDVLRNAQGDTWSSSGAFTDAGVFHDNPGFFGGSSTYHVVRTFRGEDGTFRVRGDVRIVPAAAAGVFDVIGHWAVLSGTRGYEGIHGAGDILEIFDTNVGQIAGSWTGFLVS
jgi:hypothetical protein